MCGIVGFCSDKNVLPFLLDGLERLEYRGYDSAGIAVLNDSPDSIRCVKTLGRIANLAQKTNQTPDFAGNIGIGHTRWATHGAASDKNAHPHLSKNKKFALVHNGIIENYAEIRDFLTQRCFAFASETDTESVAHLIEYYYRGDVVEALVKAAQRLKGSYALAVLCVDTPNTLYAMRKDSPLVIGIDGGAGMLASDMSALLEYTHEFIIPDDGEIALLSKNSAKIINFNGETITKERIKVDFQRENPQKTGYENYMLKEIYEQPKAVTDTLNSLKEKIGALQTVKNVKKLHIVGCGSAYHAGLAAKYFIEKIARISVECEIASEFRYKDPLITGTDTAVAVSQSGETADTIAAMTEAKKSCRTLGLVNVFSSTLARAADEVVYTLAGPEIAVATTKGYLCQVASLWYIGLNIAKKTNQKALPQITQMEKDLEHIGNDIADLLENKQIFQQLSARFMGASYAFFIGRGIDYAIALEGALKLKEISYIHAQSYPAGELKHGTISLIEKGSLVIAISTDESLVEKTVNNIAELRARGAVVLGISCFDQIKDACDYFAPIKQGLTSPLLAAVSLQLFAYYTALARACDIDKPRNLAKSVTVE